MDDKSLKIISAKLDAIIKLMVFRMTEGKAQTEQVRLLSLAGLPPKVIAETLGTTPNTVNVALSNLRKQKMKGASRRGKIKLGSMRQEESKPGQDSEGIQEK